MASALSASAATAKPNLLPIAADDLGWIDVGFDGYTDIPTPHLETRAATGARLAQFYTAWMCAPTRACLMTRRYPFRSSLQMLVIPSTSPCARRPIAA